MKFPLLVGILIVCVAIVPQSTAIKCFKCKSESDCDSNYNFRNDSQNKLAEYTEEGCTFNPRYTPACLYIINKESVVRERGCGGAGVTSKVSFCTNRFKDELICYCTTDWCNGIDSSNSAGNVAQEHFRRQEQVDKKENDGKNAATAIGAMFAPLYAVIVVLNSICG